MSVAVTAAFVTAGAAAHNARMGREAGKDALRANMTAEERAIEEQRRQYDTTRADFAPWRQAGEGALNRLTQASTGDMSAFQASPDYNFRLNEGTRNLENRFSVSGGGGNAMRALAEYSQNIASNEFGNWWNRQSGIAGVGQAATNSTANFGANAANNISNQYRTSGDNAASIGLYNNVSSGNALNAGIGNALYGFEELYKRKNP